MAACLVTVSPTWSGAGDSATGRTSRQANIAKSEASWETLLGALQSENPKARKKAAEQLTRLADAAKPALPELRKLLKDEAPMVRATAARAVWEIGGQADRAVPVLVDLLNSSNKNHRELAAYYLGPMGRQAKAAIPALEKAMTDQDASLRIHAAEALAQIEPETPASANLLIEAMQSPRADVRSLAAMALGQVDPVHAEKVRPVLKAALADSDPGVRTSAELAIESFNREAAHSGAVERKTTVLSQIVEIPASAETPEEPTEENTTPFAPANAESEPPSRLSDELNRAIRDLSHAHPAIRKNALERISWMGADAEPAFVDVTTCLNDPGLEIRAYAAKTLWDIDPQSALAAVNTLKELVDSTQPDVRSLAVFYLGYIGPKASSALPVLKRALATSESGEQLQIAEAVARIRPQDPDAVNVLIGGLGDPVSGIRFQAAYALSEVSPVHAPHVVPALSNAKADQNPRVRQAAELALENFPQTVDTPSLADAESAPSHQKVSSKHRSNTDLSGVSPVELIDPEPIAPVQAVEQPTEESRILPIPDEAPAETESANMSDEISEEHSEGKENRLGLGDDYKPIGSLNVTITPKRRDEDGKRLELPTNYGAAWLQTRPTEYQPTGESRPWPVQSVQYAASDFSHQPLYFEEINLERYGHNFGSVMQPFVSAAAFYGRAPLLPYMMAADHPWERQYTLGHYRPGKCLPYRPHRLPVSASGSLLEAGLVTGLFFAIY